ncbi:hypothetical protein [Paenibacillus macerans]|uniref:hypothetical protein n=1 Tax=Paenibacillus macerans TaxID=44252 RepID=UPI00203AE0E2|nr:hypothetical protein [Paenibacillus macerans]MCM3702367.1 hypothetical protein [Paenibacillus macerans]
MNEQIKARIEELKAELAAGQQMMQELDEKRGSLSFTMTRISGAVQVLEELAASEEAAAEAEA